MQKEILPRDIRILQADGKELVGEGKPFLSSENDISEGLKQIATEIARECCKEKVGNVSDVKKSDSLSPDCPNGKAGNVQIAVSG
jgi:hypothetical protein